MDNSIRNKIKNIRELKNYTQEYMACQLGISQSGYNKIEKGKIILKKEKLEKIAFILELSFDDLISFDCQKYFNRSNAEGWNHNEQLIKSENRIVHLEELLQRAEMELDSCRKKLKSFIV